MAEFNNELQRRKIEENRIESEFRWHVGTFLKVELTRLGMSYDELCVLLNQRFYTNYKPTNISDRLSKGNYTASFLFKVMIVLDIDPKAYIEKEISSYS